MKLLRKIRSWFAYREVLRYLNKHYPINGKMLRDLEFIKELIIKINHGMTHDLIFDVRAIKEIKDDLIAFLLKHFRNEVKVGYLVGALHSIRLDEDYEFFTSEKDIIDDLKARFKGKLVSYRIYPKYWDDPYDYPIDWYVKAFYWSDDDYLRYYEYARNGDFEALEEDYYGLVEIDINGVRIHFIAPRIEKIARYIKKFDYIYVRWRVYGWKNYYEKKGEPEEIAKAIWYASHISKKAREILFNYSVLGYLIKDKKLLNRFFRYKDK